MSPAYHEGERGTRFPHSPPRHAIALAHRHGLRSPLPGADEREQVPDPLGQFTGRNGKCPQARLLTRDGRRVGNGPVKLRLGPGKTRTRFTGAIADRHHVVEMLPLKLINVF
jgi:hypothetical protein